MNAQVKIRPNSRKEEVFNMLKRNPNSTTKELSVLMPHIKIDDISHAVSSMTDKNIVFVTDKKSEVGPSGRICTHRAYSVKYEKKSTQAPLKVAPQSDLFGQLVKTLEAEVTTLTLWKEAAILRYPDLDVHPLVLEARALLAKEAEAEGNQIQADDILKGNRDHSFSVRALVKILSR